MSPSETSPADGIPGDAIGLDEFADLEPIGSGGFADVYRAWDPQLRRHVAVKVLRITHLDDEVGERFSTETRAMGAISSFESIVSLYKSGFTAGGRPFLVMEYCGGGSASAALKELSKSSDGPGMHVSKVLEIGLAVAEGLRQAHRHGIVHGDVKPSNILFGTYSPKLTDFGIAAFTHDRSGTSPIGVSFQYTAPEVLRWEPVTPSADLYSLGATLYVLLGGKVPFPADNAEGVLRKVQQEPPPPLVKPGAPARLTQLIYDLMAKNPADRPRDISDVIDRLQRLVSADPAESTVAVSRQPSMLSARADTPSPTRMPAKKSRAESVAEGPVHELAPAADGSSLRRLVATILALLTIIGAATWWFGRSNETVPSDAEITRHVVPLLNPATHTVETPRSEPLAPHDLEVEASGNDKATLRWSIDGKVSGYVIAASQFAGGPVSPDTQPTDSGYITADGVLSTGDGPLLRIAAANHHVSFPVDLSRYTCFRVVSLVNSGLIASEEQTCLPVNAPESPERPSVELASGRATITWSPVVAASGYAVLEMIDDDGEKVIEQVVVDDGVRSATLVHHEGAGYVVVALNAVNSHNYPTTDPPADRVGWSEPNVP